MFNRQNSHLTFSTSNSISLQKWFFSATGFFLLSIITGLLIIMILNGGLVNHLLTPVLQHISLFTVLWDENPMRAVQFLLTKSVIVFAHKDPRSGLNLWTYEFDSITLCVYIIIAFFCGKFVFKFLVNPRRYRRAALLGLLGSLLILISISYMTVIEHCAGATWVGFVSMYGMGFDEFELYPFWQWLCAGLGIIALIFSTYFFTHKSMNEI